MVQGRAPIFFFRRQKGRKAFIHKVWALRHSQSLTKLKEWTHSIMIHCHYRPYSHWSYARDFRFPWAARLSGEPALLLPVHESIWERKGPRVRMSEEQYGIHCWKRKLFTNLGISALSSLRSLVSHCSSFQTYWWGVTAENCWSRLVFPAISL